MPLMLYNAPRTYFGPDLLLHKNQTMAELNGLNQARRSRVFPVRRNINTTLRLKDGRTLRPKGMSGLSSMSPRINYNSKSTPYLSGRRRGGLGNFITDAFSGISNTVTGTVSALTGTVSGVANAAQPLEKLLQDNPSLINLVKSYIPTASKPTPVTVVSSVPTTIPTTTLGISNKVWLVGALGTGALVLTKLLGRR